MPSVVKAFDFPRTELPFVVQASAARRKTDSCSHSTPRSEVFQLKGLKHPSSTVTNRVHRNSTGPFAVRSTLLQGVRFVPLPGAFYEKALHQFHTLIRSPPPVLRTNQLQSFPNGALTNLDPAVALHSSPAVRTPAAQSPLSRSTPALEPTHEPDRRARRTKYRDTTFR